MPLSISERTASLVRMTMADMADLADRKPGAIRLENADTYLSPPAAAIQATKDAIGVDRYNSYLPLQGLAELRQAIADRYEADLGLHYDPEGEVLVTSGAGEAMLDVLLGYVNPKDKVLLSNPTYNGMAQRVRLAGGEQVFVDLEEERDWHFDSAVLRSRAAGCKVLFFMSPAMPTGTVLGTAETEAIAEAATEHDALVLFNGAFDKVVYDGRQVIHPATLPGMRERTISVGSVSKNYNMIGWRIGWAVGPRALLKPIHDIHIFNAIMPSGFAEAGATAALSGPQEGVATSVATYERQRNILVSGLRSISGLKVISPEGGYFCLGNISSFGVTSTEFCQQLLAEEDVATTPMVAWGSDTFGSQHVRFIFTNEPEDRLREAALRIGAFIERKYRSA